MLTGGDETCRRAVRTFDSDTHRVSIPNNDPLLVAVQAGNGVHGFSVRG